jgi:hypothetical protein
MAWGLTQANAPWYDRTENLAAEMTSGLICHLKREIVPSVIHCEEDPFQDKAGVQAVTNEVNGMQDLSKKALAFVEKVYIPDLLAVQKDVRPDSGSEGRRPVEKDTSSLGICRLNPGIDLGDLRPTRQAPRPSSSMQQTTNLRPVLQQRRHSPSPPLVRLRIS